ncbi:hypothetical protein EJB05_11988, partial [Eragrostis curvula]
MPSTSPPIDLKCSHWRIKTYSIGYTDHKHNNGACVCARPRCPWWQCARRPPPWRRSHRGSALCRRTTTSSTQASSRGDQQLACNDPKDNKAACNAKCDKRCPNQCIVLCPGCQDLLQYCATSTLVSPAVTHASPAATATTSTSTARRTRDFCIVSDSNLHINAHFIGKRNPAMSRDFTWIQALGIRFADHRLFMGAQKDRQVEQRRRPP